MNKNNKITKTILVAGGAGFLGSHLCEVLLQNKDHQVICVDNFLTGQFSNIELLIQHPRFKFIQHDIIEPLNINVDEIYNMACPASPIQYQKNPIHTLRTNFDGSYHLLELARKNKARFLLSSTSEVYGDPEVHPQKENYWGSVNPNGIRACYDEGKRCAETLSCEFFRKYHFPIKIARIFNTYGPRMHTNDGRVVSNFINEALQNKNITIYGNGQQTRSFCYVDDLIQGLIKLMASTDDFIGPVNIGNPIEYSMLDIAELILKLTKSKSKISFLPLPEDDPKRRKPDISLAKKILAWQPEISLEKGLERTILYFSKFYPIQKKKNIRELPLKVIVNPKMIESKLKLKDF